MRDDNSEVTIPALGCRIPASVYTATLRLREDLAAALLENRELRKTCDTLTEACAAACAANVKLQQEMNQARGDMSDAELTRLEQLCEKATAGPWDNRANVRTVGVDCIPLNLRCCSWAETPVASDRGQAEHDAAFIAAARDALPRLIALVRAQDARIDELEAELRFRTNDVRD